MLIKPLDGVDREPQSCFKQFVFRETKGAVGHEGWVDESWGAWTLSRCPSLPRVEIRDGQGAVGLLLGWFVLNGSFYQEDGVLQLDAEATLDAVYEALVGRFVLVDVRGGELHTLRLDASGKLAVVYDAAARSVGSTPTVLARYRRLEPDQEVLREVRRSDGRTWFPFGLVPYEGVRRLLPGQVLSMSSLEVSDLPTLFSDSHSDIDVSTILDTLTNVCKAIAAEGPVQSHLTAGVDSRMVLAAILRSGVPATLITLRGNDDGTRLDDHVARSLAKACGLRHRTIPVIPSGQDEIEAWHERSGYCVDDAVVGLGRTVRETFDVATVLTGACGEVGRAFLWTQADRGKIGLDPGDLVGRLGFAESSMLRELAARWIDQVGSELATTRLLDLAYIQQRLGSWAGPAVYGHAITKPTFPPFNSVGVYASILALPDQFRVSGGLPRALISEAYPRLLEWPFNQAQGVARLLFPKQELKRHMPPELKRSIKSLLRLMKSRSSN